MIIPTTHARLVRRASLALVATALSASLSACAASARSATGGAAAVRPAEPGMGREAAIARARADSARLPWTMADVHFMTSMIGHHAQAIEMSKLAESNGASPSILTLAGRITNAQRDEINIMRTWLQDRLQPAPDPFAPGGAGAHDTHDAHAGHAGMGGDKPMAGMLTPAQMQQLAAARGPAFDELFLTFMIQHHEGAVSMVKELFATPGAGQDETVFRFATDVNVDQTTEIKRMRLMLLTLPAGRE